METRVIHFDAASEFLTPERCFIIESWNEETDEAVSIARARVRAHVTTQLHTLDVAERYVFVEGTGLISVGDLAPARVGIGDVVGIPPDPQQVANTGRDDLIFYCICSPRFRPKLYHSLESAPPDERTMS